MVEPASLLSAEPSAPVEGDTRLARRERFPVREHFSALEVVQTNLFVSSLSQCLEFPLHQRTAAVRTSDTREALTAIHRNQRLR